MNFPERLRTLRIEHGLTQDALAERVGIGRISIVQYESGTRKPKYKRLIKLAAILNTTIDYLLEEGKETVADASADYLTPTGDPLKDDIRRTLYKLLEKDKQISVENLHLLAGIANHIARDEHKRNRKNIIPDIKPIS